jgi:CRP-like cAMP-binding protein
MNMPLRVPSALVAAAVTRLANLAPLSESDHAALRDAEAGRRRIPAHREIQAEGARAGDPLLLLSGWAARVRSFSDGRRQILAVVLPGDLIGGWHHGDLPAPISVVALSEVAVIPAPAARPGTGLAMAYAAAAAAEERCLYRQIARLGRLSAYERVADWLLEIHDRLAAAGLANGNSFPMPLTQEVLADALGLTSVHINRTLQSMRRDGVVDLRSGTARLPDLQQLADLVDYRAL